MNGVSPPVGADKVVLKDGDVVLWYYATFGAAGGPPTLELKRLPGNCYVVESVTDAGKRTRAATATLVADGKRFRTRAGRACIGKHAGSSGRPLRAPSARTRCSDPARARALFVLVLLAGCGGAAGGEEGTAQLWVTRDRGAELLVDAEVDAGQTLMRALAAEADVETRYGGRFVQSVNGIEGSLGDQRDWFWFVNGYEGDRSAAAYRLRDGDVAWLDYRAWEREGEARVVVGAFPEPFVHGYDGRTRPVASATSRRSARVPARFARQFGRGGLAASRSDARAGGGERARGARAGRLGSPASCSARPPAIPVRFVLSGDADVRAAVQRPVSPAPQPCCSPPPARPRCSPIGSGRSSLLTVVLLAVCLRAPAERRGVYLFGALTTGLGVLVLSPFLWSSPDGTVLWEGPTIPVLGPLDVTTDGALRGGAERVPADRARARVRGLRAPARPRPARRRGRRGSPLGARGRARDAARALARA